MRPVRACFYEGEGFSVIRNRNRAFYLMLERGYVIAYQNLCPGQSTCYLTVGVYMDVQKISALMVILVLYFPYSQAQGTYGRESTIYKK